MAHARLGIAEENSGRLVAQVRNVAADLAKKFKKELILGDGPPGTGCPVIASVTGSDLVLIVNTIQFIKEKSVFLNNIRGCLKEDGKLVFVQWDAEKMDSEAPGWNSEDREKYTMRTMLKMIYDADYEVLEIKDFLPMQLIYICQPSPASDPKYLDID